MPRKISVKNGIESAEEALRNLPRQEILALASKLFNTVKAQAANGKVMTQEEMRILSATRQQLLRHGAMK